MTTTKLCKPPAVTEKQYEVIHRHGVTEKEIEAVLRDEHFWSFILRNPEGRVCHFGIDTQGGCVRWAFAAHHFCMHAVEMDDGPESFGPWHFTLWPPKPKPGYHNNWWNDFDLQDPTVPDDYVELSPREQAEQDAIWREEYGWAGRNTDMKDLYCEQDEERRERKMGG